ncbi:putative reverse transcriptase domain-containing protein [Tanacetum coccineum]
MINQGVTAALATRDADRNTSGDYSHILGASVRRTEQTTRECTYTDFLKCQPLNIKGTEGFAGLSQWFERMEFVFHISNCTVENQVKFATCTLHSVALTWWNTHVKTVGDVERNNIYGYLKPLCSKCNYHYDGPCAPKCHKCNKVGHFARDCRSTVSANNANNQRGTGSAKVYVVGHAGTNPDSNVVTACVDGQELRWCTAVVLVERDTDEVTEWSSFKVEEFSDTLEYRRDNKSSSTHKWEFQRIWYTGAALVARKPY